jgi:cytochrome c553
MIAAAAVVLIFLTLGLSVFFVAIRGGARGARDALHSQTPVARRVTFIGIPILLLLLTVLVPALVLAGNDNGHSRVAPGGIKLSAAEARGRRLFAENCATCHTLKAARAVGKVGPNLDVLTPPKVLILDAIAKGRARGNGQMPAQLLTGRDAVEVATFVAQVEGR